MEYRGVRRVKADIKEKWVKALRSGKYKQTEGVLENNKGNCCLGVLCRALDFKEIGRDKQGNVIFEENVFDNCSFPPSILSDKNLNQFGISADEQATLYQMNDSFGKSFSEIADYIEANL